MQDSKSLSTATYQQLAANWSQPNVDLQGYLASTVDLLDSGSGVDEDTDTLEAFFAREGAKARRLPPFSTFVL
jgi:hypothetical protein